jgi:PAS domain S-box-containing protein
MLGYSRDEIIGKRVFDFTDEKNSAIMKEAIVLSRKGERDIYRVSIRNKSGSFIPLIVSTTHMQDEKGQYIGTVQLGSDMTVQTKIEDELREAKARSDMYLDLLSHDIRNIDQIVIGYLEMAINKLEAGEHITNADMELLKKPLKALYSSAELIDTVKNLKKVKTVRLPREKMDLCKVVSAVVNDFSIVPDRAINIHFCPVKECWVEANFMLKEIFINLIGNAIKHSKGPLEVYVNINEEVTIDGIRYYAVLVEDTGPGIADALKSRLFSDVYCNERLTSGKGIGLCLVKALVDIFHGKVWLEDREPGDLLKGAKFVVLLPVTEN